MTVMEMQHLLIVMRTIHLLVLWIVKIKSLCTNLDHYFKLPKEKAIDSDRVKDKMKGLKYKKTANNYLFKKR